MNGLSNAEAALLGLLSEEPMYPYQIEQQVQYRDMRFWTELSMSSIYKLLKKLENEAFVIRENRISPQNRVQKLYSVSEKGRAALEDKLQAILGSAEHIRWQVDIGTYNADLLPPEKVREALAKYREDLLQKIKGYKDLLAFLKESNCPSHRFAVAIRPVYLLEAEVKWVDSFLGDLRSEGGN